MRLPLAISLIFIVFTSPDAHSENIRFTLFGELPPFQYLKEDGDWTGWNVEVIREVCQQFDMQPEFHPFPWKRALRSVKRGEMDAIFLLYKNPKREEFLHYVPEPMDFTRTVIIAMKENNIKISSLEELKAHDIGVIAAYAYSREFDNFKGLKKTQCQYTKQLVKMLYKGRVSLAASAEGEFRAAMKELKFENKHEVIYVLSKRPLHVGFSKAVGPESRVWAEKFNDALLNLKKSGRFEEIKTKFQPE